MPQGSVPPAWGGGEGGDWDKVGGSIVGIW